MFSRYYEIKGFCDETILEISQFALNLMTRVLITDRKVEDTIEKRIGHVRMGAEIGVK